MIALGCDHGGYNLMVAIKKYLDEKGIAYKIGISMAANKVKGVRAAVVNNEFGAEMTRRHNHANILCMGGRVIDEAQAVKFTDIFLNTPEEGGRHDKRVAMVTAIEDGTFEG